MERTVCLWDIYIKRCKTCQIEYVRQRDSDYVDAFKKMRTVNIININKKKLTKQDKKIDYDNKEPKKIFSCEIIPEDD